MSTKTLARKPRLLVGVLLAAAVVLTLAPAQLARAHSTRATTTISFLTPPWGIPPSKAALSAFEKSSGITVQINSLPSAQLYSKVQVASATHQAPADVIFLTEEAPSNIVAPGDMLPLGNYVKSSSSLNTKDIQQFNFWRYKGQQYGITSYVQMVMMDYDTAHLKKAGFSTAPKTWSQLNSQALAIKRRGIDKYPIAMAAIDWSWYLMALSMGDRMVDKNLNPVFANPNSPARQALRLLFTFYKEKLISPSLLTAVDPHTLYESGIGSFHQSWEGALAVMNNPKLSKHAGHDQYLLLPNKHYTWSFPAGLGISKYSSNPAAAWKFIQWYLQPAQQKAIYAGYGLLPSRTSVQHQLAGANQIQGYSVIAQQARYRHELPRYVPWWGSFTSFVTTQIREGMAGQTSADSAINAMAAKWKSLKSQYGG